MNSWKDHLKQKLTGQSVGNKGWWSSIKQRQCFSLYDSIPPNVNTWWLLSHKDQSKAQLLPAHFIKVTVAHPECAAPAVPTLTKAALGNITITKEGVLQQLKQVGPKKAMGPDNISPHVLKRCTTQLATALVSIFQRCFSSQQWPTQWKVARVCAIHIKMIKKKSRCDPHNYRLISLLSVVGRVFELIMTAKMTKFFDFFSPPAKFQAIWLSKRNPQ